MYDKVTCRIRNKVEVSKHYSGRFGAPGMKREEKKKATPEEMAKQNHWRRCRDLRRLIELNFSGGDWHVTLNCRKEERPTREEAPKVIREYLARLRREYKKKGWDLKYVITCETGDRGAVHWHMVTENLAGSSKVISQLWKRGRAYFSALDNSGDYQKLADYLVKETARRIDRGETSEKLSYSRSRNLIKPKERREKVRANGWRLEPKIPPGWELIPGSLINEVNKFTGLPYQHYAIRRKEDGDGRGQPVRDRKPKGTAPPGRSRDVPTGNKNGKGNGHEGEDPEVG